MSQRALQCVSILRWVQSMARRCAAMRDLQRVAAQWALREVRYLVRAAPDRTRDASARTASVTRGRVRSVRRRREGTTWRSASGQALRALDCRAGQANIFEQSNVGRLSGLAIPNRSHRKRRPVETIALPARALRFAMTAAQKRSPSEFVSATRADAAVASLHRLPLCRRIVSQRRRRRCSGEPVLLSTSQ